MCEKHLGQCFVLTALHRLPSHSFVFCERTLPSIASNNAVIVYLQLVTFNYFPLHLDVK